jgi:glycerol kinase
MPSSGRTGAPSKLCERLKQEGLEPTFSRRPDYCSIPIFPARSSPGSSTTSRAHKREAGEGRALLRHDRQLPHLAADRRQSHATDATNACRTLLSTSQTGAGTTSFSDILDIPRAMLPEVKDCADDFGVTDRAYSAPRSRSYGVAGDQQAATIGQACFDARHDEVDLWHRLLRAAQHRHRDGALEEPAADHDRLPPRTARPPMRSKGSIFIAGAAVQWLRDGLKVIRKAVRDRALAAASDPTQDVYLVPALRRPRRALLGFGSPRRDLRPHPQYGAAPNSRRLRSNPSATRPATSSMPCSKDWKGAAVDTVLRVDGGMVASDWTMQRLADILDAPVDRPTILETTALGAAWLAGSKAGRLAGCAGVFEELGAGASLRADDRCRAPQAQARRLEAGRKANAVTLML